MLWRRRAGRGEAAHLILEEGERIKKTSPSELQISITLMGFVSRGLLGLCTAFFSFFFTPTSMWLHLGVLTTARSGVLHLFHGPTCVSMDLHAKATAFYNHGIPKKRNNKYTQLKPAGRTLKDTNASTFTSSTT